MKFDLKKLPLIFIISAVLFTVLFLVIAGISVWILIFGAVWALFYLIFIAQKITLSFIKHEAAWLFFGLLIVVSLVFMFAVDSPGANKTGTSEKKLTPEECAPIFEAYNEEVLSVTSDGLRGSIGVTINPETCEADVNYNFLFNANLPRNFTVADVAEWGTHEYSGGLIRPDEKREYSDGQSMIDAVYENKNTLPNPFDFGFGDSVVDSYNPTRNEYRDSDTFYTGWASHYIFSVERWDQLKEYTKFEVADAGPYVVTTATDDGGESYSTDYDKAFTEGSVVASFNLTISE